MSDLRIFFHSHSRPLVRGVLLKSVFRFESKLLVRDFFDSWETFSPLRYLFAQDGLDQLNSGARFLRGRGVGLIDLAFRACTWPSAGTSICGAPTASRSS